MSSVLYYSNYCDKCKSILRLLGKSKEKGTETQKVEQGKER